MGENFRYEPERLSTRFIIMSNFIKKYFIDILLLGSIWLFSYVTYSPLVATVDDFTKKIQPIGATKIEYVVFGVHKDYSNLLKFLAITLFTLGIDIAIRRHFLSKFREKNNDPVVFDKTKSTKNDDAGVNLKHNLTNKLGIFLGEIKRFIKFITKDGSFTLQKESNPFINRANNIIWITTLFIIVANLFDLHTLSFLGLLGMTFSIKYLNKAILDNDPNVVKRAKGIKNSLLRVFVFILLFGVILWISSSI